MCLTTVNSVTGVMNESRVELGGRMSAPWYTYVRLQYSTLPPACRVGYSCLVYSLFLPIVHVLVLACLTQIVYITKLYICVHIFSDDQQFKVFRQVLFYPAIMRRYSTSKI